MVSGSTACPVGKSTPVDTEEREVEMFGDRVIVSGHSSGLGKEIANALTDPFMDRTIIGWSKDTVDIRDRNSIDFAVASLGEPVDILINCAGVNYIDWFTELDEGAWDNVMDTNAKGIFLLSQALIKKGKLRNGGTILNIVSNASHMPMTHSAAYNASKGAAEILTRQMARELKATHDITVFGISPNKLAGTGMSQYIESRVVDLRGWTAEEAREYQLKALPAGEETDPKAVALFINFLLASKANHKYLHGCIIPYGA